MPRVCSISRLYVPFLAVLLLAAFGSVAWAKPKVAILGLEVANSGVVDPKDAVYAGKLTEELRQHARAGAGKFEMAPNSNRELQDEKLMANCDTEKPACMAPIGQGLNAEYLIYGRIEKSPDKSKEGYKLSIKILNVKTKQIEENWDGFLALGQINGAGLKDWSKSVHAKLSGEKLPPPVVTGPAKGLGKLVVKIGNTKSGTVLIDGEKKGELADGAITLTLPDGPHLVAIEATGRRRYEEPVTITTNETKTVSTELEEIVGPPPPPPSKSSSAGTWRKVMWGSVGVGVAAGAVWTYAYTKIKNAEDGLACLETMPGCIPLEREKKLRDQGNSNQTLSFGMGAVVGVAGVVAIIGAWKGYFSKPATEKVTGTASLRKRRQLEVTPVVTSGGAGATLRYDW